MRQVGIYLFDDVELLDFAGPYEAFTAVGASGDPGAFRVCAVSEDGKDVRTVNGLRVGVDYGFADHPELDLLVLPGGEGTKAALKRPPVLPWIARVAAGAERVLSVCSGARFLGALGLLEGLEATTHHTVLDDLARLAPGARIRPEARFTDNGKILTAGGVSAGIDLALHVIGALRGPETLQRTRAYMEYGAWRDETSPRGQRNGS